jgi:hypothetical protein
VTIRLSQGQKGQLPTLYDIDSGWNWLCEKKLQLKIGGGKVPESLLIISDV